MSIRYIDLDDPILAGVTILGDIADLDDDNIDVHAHLRKGGVLPSPFSLYAMLSV